MNRKQFSRGSLGRRLSAYSLAAGAAVAASAVTDLSARVVVYDNGGAGWYDDAPYSLNTPGPDYDLILFKLDGTVLVDDSEIDAVTDRSQAITLTYSWWYWEWPKVENYHLTAEPGAGAGIKHSGYIDTVDAIPAGSTGIFNGPPPSTLPNDWTGGPTKMGMAGYGWYSLFGYWVTGARGYMGFYIDDDEGGRHYGWADISSNSQWNEVTLHAFAYETAPGHSITAGATGPAPIVGDFDGDGDVDAADADLLSANFGDAAYDLDLDGDADADDLAYLINYCADLPGGGIGTSVGDFNLDGLVDGTDLSVMAGQFGQSAGYAAGNANGDSTIDGTDLSILATNFGNVASANIPEPATLSLLALGAGGLVAHRRRK